MKTAPARIISENYKAMSRAAAQLFMEASQLAISKHGRFTVALSGGSTPKEFLKSLASPSFNRKINWEKIVFFWSDERFVPHNSSYSNFHLAKTFLFKKIAVPASNIFPAPVKGSPEKSATGYEQTIKKTLGSKTCFDWIMLGVGNDGHTASLFPGSSSVLEKKKLVTAVLSDTDSPWRISFSFPLINRARQIIVLVSGKEKAAVVKTVFTKGKNRKYPVQHLDPAKSLWLMDKEAAGK